MVAVRGVWSCLVFCPASLRASNNPTTQQRGTAHPGGSRRINAPWCRLPPPEERPATPVVVPGLAGAGGCPGLRCRPRRPYSRGGRHGGRFFLRSAFGLSPGSFLLVFRPPWLARRAGSAGPALPAPGSPPPRPGPATPDAHERGRISAVNFSCLVPAAAFVPFVVACLVFPAPASVHVRARRRGPASAQAQICYKKTGGFFFLRLGCLIHWGERAKQNGCSPGSVPCPLPRRAGRVGMLARMGLTVFVLPRPALTSPARCL